MITVATKESGAALTLVQESQMQTRQLERLIALLVFLLCFAYLCIPLRYSSLEPDEGIVLLGAERVLHGQVPYRDFFTFYTPGSFYFLALLFRAFGDSFIVARASLAVAGALCSLLTYVLTRRVCSRRISLFVAALTTLVGTGFRFLVLHNWYSTLLACLALYATLRFVEGVRPGWAFVSGFFASLTFLFEQSKGAGLCLGFAFGLLLLHLVDRKRRINKFAILALASGLAAPLLLTFAY